MLICTILLLLFRSCRIKLGFPYSSVGKESPCNARDPGSIPGSLRLAGEGIGYTLQCSWVSLVAQLVKLTIFSRYIMKVNTLAFTWHKNLTPSKWIWIYLWENWYLVANMNLLLHLMWGLLFKERDNEEKYITGYINIYHCVYLLHFKTQIILFHLPIFFRKICSYMYKSIYEKTLSDSRLSVM